MCVTTESFVVRYSCMAGFHVQDKEKHFLSTFKLSYLEHNSTLCCPEVQKESQFQSWSDFASTVDKVLFRFRSLESWDLGEFQVPTDF